MGEKLKWATYHAVWDAVGSDGNENAEQDRRVWEAVDKILAAASNPTPEALEAWAEWFDDPGKSPAIGVPLVTTGGALPQATPGYLLREIARRLRAARETNT